jgi:hypothetical protein
MGYQFAAEPHAPPDQKTHKLVEKIEKASGEIPLSLRAFYRNSGQRRLDGQVLRPFVRQWFRRAWPAGRVFPTDVLKNAAIRDGQGAVIIAPDDLQKANVSGGPPYEIVVPEMGADGKLLHERHVLNFVDYLRLVFRYGGFPGYDGVDKDVPVEIAALKEGLIPF